jgi:HEAT repeat protein
VACREELARQRSFLDVVDRRENTADGTLLASCRAQLRQRIEARADSASHQGWNVWMEKLAAFSRFHIPFRVPAGALALIALGWIGAKYTPQKFGGMAASMAEPTFSTVRSIEPDNSGKFQIAVDEVRRRVVTGDPDDSRIRELLLNAIHEESNAGVRAESAGALKELADSSEVRKALLDSVSHDPSPAVRLKALEGLKPWAGEPDVRKSVAEVLLRDENASVRVQAIDVLTAHHDDSIVGVLQDAVQKEDNSYVRARCQRLLEAMKASVGTY